MEFLWFSLIRAPHLERGLKPLGEFPAAGGPQTFFAGPPTVCVCRSRGRSPAVSTSCVLLRVAGAGATHSPPGARTSSSRRRKSRHSPQAAGTGRDRGARVGLSDGVHDLFLGELRPLHGSTPFARDHRSCHRALVFTCRRFLGRRPSIQPSGWLSYWFHFQQLRGYGVTACFIAALSGLIER